MKRIILRKDSYYDSVFLMLISTEVKKMEGVTEAVVAMGTEMNLELIGDMGMGGSELDAAGPNDLIIALKAEKKAILDEAESAVEELLSKKAQQGSDAAYRHTSTAAALEALPESNLVVVSVPGEHAPREVRKALRADKHVMLFSDNVSLEEEIKLKALARERGLLLMGPDCGTAIINGKPICFANVVNTGGIGVVSASGTGLQEVTSLISRMGGGISQGIGTGGRDLKSEKVGGSTTLMAIEALAKDPETVAIAVVSKPPAASVAEKVVAALGKAGKPAVVHLIGMEKRPTRGNLHYAGNLEETARMAVSLAAGKPCRTQVFDADEKEIEAILERETNAIGSRQKYLRGYFTGGTLTDEAVFVLNETLGGIYSFDPADPAFKLSDPHVSRKHTIVDLGEDVFTVGRPHPMIDPSTRTDRMKQEIDDGEIALVMIDCVIGYGSHPDPAGAVAPAIRAMKSAAEKRGAYLTVVASITGTDGDFQNFAAQKRTLEEAGAVVMPSNYQAAELAKHIMIRLNSR
ncbi:MAG: acyl-CoA synthetase FdrA [Spirochaetaceae bacterium]|nr:MAG: acyl-CoA synthetase FdrA [Spirochaetaceae bacterium]